MPKSSPQPISAAQLQARENRVRQIAIAFGFVGTVEYRHVYSQTGGAQYGRGSSRDADLLTVYAEAFERDADPDDFSLKAILAHERGHQILGRHERIRRNLPIRWSGISEEIVASILASLIVRDENDRQALLLKAVFDADKGGMPSKEVTPLIIELRTLLEKIL
jgi:hypothetical protein